MDEERTPTIRQLLYVSAESMKRAFPTYAELTAGDITIGLACVAIEHKKQHVSRDTHAQPLLYRKDPSDYDYDITNPLHFAHKLNPDAIDPRKLLLAQQLLPYAIMVYYPIVSNNRKHYVLMPSDDMSLVTGDIITRKSEHRKFRAHPVNSVLKFECVSDHMKQAFLVKVDYNLRALIISVRGTDSIRDVFTNFTCEPMNLTVHKSYSMDEFTTEETITGIVHRGKLNGAKWILSQIECIIKLIIFPSEKIKFRNIDTILTVGHSLGGAVATLLAILLREYMLANRHHFIDHKLPDIRAVTFSPSAFLSENLSRWCRSFVDSLIIGADMVPRFSVGQADRLCQEIMDTDYLTIVGQYLKDHNKVASMLDRVNGYLSNKGRNPLLRPTTRVVDRSAAKSTTERSHKDSLAKDKSIETLYPPGNLIWFACEKEIKQEKDFPKILFEFIEQKLARERSTNNESLTTGRIFDSWWKYSRKDKNIKQRKCAIRSVDAKHFDRIILTRKMFKDHSLLNFVGMLEYVTNGIGLKEVIKHTHNITIIENYFK